MFWKMLKEIVANMWPITLAVGPFVVLAFATLNTTAAVFGSFVDFIVVAALMPEFTALR
jgi:hypothetical protein